MSKSVANIPPGLGHCPPLGDPIPDEILHEAGVPSYTPGPGDSLTYQNTDNGDLYTWNGEAWLINGGGGGSSHDPVTVSDSPTVDLTLTGQALSAAVKLSADAGNQVEARADGVYVPAPPAGHDAVTVSDSPTVDLTLTGQALAAAVKLSADAGNQAEARPDGVYVPAPPAGHDAVTVSDSPTVDLTLTGQALAAAVKLSADAGNQAEARPDGVYVPTPDAAPIQTVADSTNIDLALTGGELSASIILDPDLNNRLEARANGLFAGVPEAFNGLLRALFNYKLGGALTEDTVISGDAYNRGFTWSQLKHFIITANSLTLDPSGDMILRTTSVGEIFIGSNTDLRLYGNTGVRVETPGVQATSVPVGAPLVLKNASTGLAEFGGMTRTVQLIILPDDTDLEDGTSFVWDVPEEFSGYNLARAKLLVRNAHSGLGSQIQMDITKGGSSMLNATNNLGVATRVASTTNINTSNDDVQEDDELTITFSHSGTVSTNPTGCRVELKFTV